MTYNPIITITLKPTVGATAGAHGVDFTKDYGVATVGLSFDQDTQIDGNESIHREGFPQFDGRIAAWDVLPEQKICGEVAELSAETALAVSTLLNKGFAMNAELNAVKPEATTCCDDGPFTPPFPATPGGTDEGDTVAAEVADFSNLEADAKAVSERLENAMKLIDMLRYADRVVCYACHGHSAVYGGADCPACHSCGYVTRSLQTVATVAPAANPGPIKKARKPRK